MSTVTLQPKLKAVNRLRVQAAALDGALTQLKRLLDQGGLLVEKITQGRNGGMLWLEGDVNEKTWRVVMDRLGFAFNGDHYEVPGFSGIGMWFRKDCVEVKPL